MKKLLTLCLLAVTMCVVAQEKKTVAVLDPIDRQQTVPTYLLTTIRMTMETAITLSSEYEAFDRSALDKLKQEQSFQHSGEVNDNTIQELGQLTGVNYILVPEVSGGDGYVMISAKVMDVEKGRYDRAFDSEFVEMKPQEVQKAARGLAVKLFGLAGSVSPHNRTEQSAEEMYQIGKSYFLGTNDNNQDYTQAVYWFKKAAEKGDMDAQYALGICYKDGLGVQQDNTQTIYWFRKAAEQGNADAQYALGLCYLTAWGGLCDNNQAVYWLKKAAETGLADAQHAIGFCYKEGQGVKQDYTQAVYWYKKASEQGLPAAQNDLGVCYFNGWGEQQNYSQAFYWFKKAAEQGNTDAQYALGLCYYNGYGTTINKQTSLYWMRKIADQGHEKAIAFIRERSF